MATAAIGEDLSRGSCVRPYSRSVLSQALENKYGVSIEKEKNAEGKRKSAKKIKGLWLYV